MKAKPTKFNVLSLIKPSLLFPGNFTQIKRVKGLFKDSHEKIDEKYLNETKELLKKLIAQSEKESDERNETGMVI